MLLVIFALGVLLAARLFYWQILQWDWLNKHVEVQSKVLQPIPPQRGRIWTRDGLLLASDQYLYTITAIPSWIDEPEALAKQLAPLVGQSREAVIAKLKSKDKSVVLAKDVPATVGEAVLELKTKDKYGLPEIGVESRRLRKYPARALAAQCVGYLNTQGQASGGVEFFMDKELRGTPGEFHGASTVLRDAPIPFDQPLYKAPANGADVVLTIDARMQQIVETELAKAVQASRATGGVIIVMDPKTGALLALAVYPTADLNAYTDPANTLRYVNSAVTAVYDPGSVFKIITVAIALETGSITPASVFNDDGRIEYCGGTFKNHEGLAPGRVTLLDVLRLSLNVEAVKIAIGVGADRFYEYVRKFGFGAKTGVELAFESAGVVKRPGDGEWRCVDLATNSFGQGISVTPLQMIAAIAAVANQGKLMRPYIVQEVRGPDGTVKKTEPKVVSQVIRPETARLLTPLLADAILAESSNRTIVPGSRVAGKTGTSEIYVFGKLDPNATIASFGGYLPADDPRFVILVKIDKPQTSKWGSVVAAPVFASVAQQLVALVGLPPDEVRKAGR